MNHTQTHVPEAASGGKRRSSRTPGAGSDV